MICLDIKKMQKRHRAPKHILLGLESGKSEKCIGCYPRIESGMPMACAESCVGRIRYVGVMLYDADSTCSY